MNYTEALEYIHSINWTFCKPGLERISELCNRLGNPEKKLKFVHVAGTNGKGSFCSMLDSVLRAQGYKTGLYTSPYVKRFNERMKFMGEEIADEDLARLTEKVRPIADSMQDKPTEFELITAIAFMYYAEKLPDVVILEAGMGGRLDSTNVIRKPLLSVITGIALDHTSFLGDTTEKIAQEKAGIIKDNAPVLFGGEDADATKVISKRALELGSSFTRVDYSELKIHKSDLTGSVFSYKNFKNVNISLLGLYQPRNASVVISAVEILRERGLRISDEALRLGLKNAAWPARFEIISKSPLIIFDGAHNPEGIESASRSIAHYFPEGVTVISGVLSDKDFRYIAKKLSEVSKRAFTITPDNPRALSAESYAAELQSNGVNATPCKDIREALLLARDEAKSDSRAIVCLGSLYTYSEIINLV